MHSALTCISAASYPYFEGFATWDLRSLVIATELLSILLILYPKGCTWGVFGGKVAALEENGIMSEKEIHYNIQVIY